MSEDLERVDLRPWPCKRTQADIDEDDEADVTYTGASPAGADGIIRLGERPKRRRPRSPVDDMTEDSELQEVEIGETRTVMTMGSGGCQACGCFCSVIDLRARGQGSGSTMLSRQVLGKILRES